MQPFAFSKTRLAPTPSGYLHAGNAVNFLLTAALAQKHNAKLLLRIDDLDRERYRTAYAQDVFDTLRFLNIQWHEGPRDVRDFEERWSQQRRMTLYETALQTLKEKGSLFACVCSRTQMATCRCFEKRLPFEAPNTSWRLLTNDEPVAVKTTEGRVINERLPPSVKNFVVRKKDGWPAYQLASVVDDLHFGIGFIVRGQDLWPSTLAQQFLAKQLGEDRFAQIAFLHHPLLTKPDGEKLSKSAGDVSVKHWREGGKSATDFLAHLQKRLQASSANGEQWWRKAGLPL